MYHILQVLHNLNRWLTLVFLFIAFFRLIKGVATNATWTKQDLNAVRRFALFMTIQFVLGIVLWVMPNGMVQLTLSAGEFKDLVKSKLFRFFILEHPVQMFFALALSHITSLITRKAAPDRKKFVLGLLFLTLTTIIVIISIPWPVGVNQEIARPWFRY